MIVHIEGKTINIKEPRPATLSRYGLSLNEWKNLLAEQGYRCPICKRIMDKRICIDHSHVTHWAKLPPEKRKLYIRGLVDWFCNHYYLGKAISIERAKNVVTYLERFEKRKPK